MNPENIKNYLNITLIVAIVVFMVTSISFVYSFTRTNQPSSAFTVSAEGKVVAVPDTAKFSFSVRTEGDDDSPIGLQQDNAKTTKAITDYLKGEGVDEKDIKTENYYINPQYRYISCRSRECSPPEISGYVIENRISVKTKDFEKASILLAGVVDLGANVVGGVQLTVDDRDALENEARAKAMKTAVEKAKNVAKSGSFRLGRLLSVDENNQGYPYPLYESRGIGGGGDMVLSMPMPVEEQEPAVDIEPGSQEIIVNVTLRYEIR
ncbi:MAG: SIMPL domain-containing protein [Patescibacteria group bacterium]|nr:SIMPL domain-containing protein [Patescibacteria group bacterium]